MYLAGGKDLKWVKYSTLTVETAGTPSSCSSRGVASPHFAWSEDGWKSHLVEHLVAWNRPSETLIILNWDDTLCPTTYLRGDPRIRLDRVAPCFAGESAISAYSAPALGENKTMLQVLEQHASATIAFLRLAASLGRVSIVTASEPGWVETSITNFMPTLTDVLMELGIEVVYARELIVSAFPRVAHDDGADPIQTMKRFAMSRVIKKFYLMRSWKNIISIGDSSAEGLALQDVIFRRQQVDSKGNGKVCRCKVIKLLSEPTVEQHTAVLQAMIAWLSKFVHHDGDIDVDFDDLDPDSPLPSKVRAFSAQISN